MNVHHTWANGVLISGDYNTVEDSSVRLSNLMYPANPAAGWASGLSAARGSQLSQKPGITSFATIRRNKVFNNWGEGLSCYEADHCAVEDNVVYDNFAVHLYLPDLTNSIVQRNLVYISSTPSIKLGTATGIALADERSSAPRSANNSLFGNCLIDAHLDAFAWILVPDSGLNNVLIEDNVLVGANLTIKSGGNPTIVNVNSKVNHNILMGNDIHQVHDATGITFTNNNCYLVVPPAATSSTDIIGDPQIIKPETIAPGSLSMSACKLPDSPLTDTDSIAPSTPTRVGATARFSQIHLVWNESTDNFKVAGYKIYRNGKEIATSGVPHYADRSVARRTSYTYAVTAFDAAGNVSTMSTTVTIQKR